MTTMTPLKGKRVPGPHSLNPLKSTLAFRHSPLQFLTELRKQYGDIAQFPLFIWPTLFMCHPDHIKHILQDNQRNYDKDVLMYRIAKPLVGNGLITVVKENDWLRQRRLAQPAFHRQRIANLGTVMTDTTNVMLQRWDTYAREQQVFDLVKEMTNLTLQIVCKSLFNIDISAEADTLRKAFMQTNSFLIEYLSIPFPPLSVRTPFNRRFWSAVQTTEAIVYEIIRNRRLQQENIGDLLAMLLDAVDGNSQEMDERQLRDEVLTLLVAGHETSANALTWTWYLLTQYPEVEERLHAELDQILAGRIPAVEDLPQLDYTRMVLEEVMRLYPPAWMLMRRAIQDDEVDGYHIPANSYILWSIYFCHRHPDFWEKPEQFYPEHFSIEHSATRPRHAYIPFGIGPRACLGNTFASTEMQLILATIAQRYRVSLVPGQHVEPEAWFTLRPKNGIQVSIERR